MFNLFKNRKLYKEFVDYIKKYGYMSRNVRERINMLPAVVLRRVGKEIIYSDYDGYNLSAITNELAYFDNLDRSQKEFYVEQRSYKFPVK